VEHGSGSTQIQRQGLRVCSTAMLLLSLVFPIAAPFAQGARSSDIETILSERIELPRLVDLCAERLALNIQYDPNELKGSVTLRLGAGLQDDELWALTNRLLAARGFTTVHFPGEEGIAVVRLNLASGLARLETDAPSASTAGFIRVTRTLQHRQPSELLPVIREVLSKPGGQANEFGSAGSILVADLRPNVEQAFSLLDLLDSPAAESLAEEISLSVTEADELVQLANQVLTARTSLGGLPLRGQLIPLPATGAVLLVAPQDERESWIGLIQQLDQGEVPSTVTYPIAGMDAEAVSRLLESVARDGSPAAERQSWRMVSDPFTGSLVLTATASQHDAVEQLLERLRSAEPVQAELEEIPVRMLDPATLVSLVDRVVSTRQSVSGRPLRGQLVAATETGSVLLIAPADERETWRDLVAQLDQAEVVETVSYAPRHFGIQDVGTLVEELARTAPGQPERFRMITDELTGTLIVTATPGQHRQIAELIARLDAADPTTRQPIRAFAIQNREAAELSTLLMQLAGSGALEADDGLGSSPGDGLSAETSPVSQPGDQVGSPLSRVAGQLTLTADESTNSIIAVGESRYLDRLEELIGSLDVRQPQVMIEVLIVGLTESDLFDLGVEFERVTTRGDTSYLLSSVFGVGSVDSGAPAPVANSLGFTGVALDPGEFSVVVSALQTLNEGRNLTIPKVLVNNNETAKLDSVLQSPYTSVNASDTVATTSFGGTLDAGTTVTVTPHITEADHLLLEYSVSISQFVGDSTDPALPPPRQDNTLESIATIPDGYTVAVGGIEVETDSEAVSQVPLLGSIPWLGELFKTTSSTATRTRLYAFIRANVLRDASFEDLKFLSSTESQGLGLEESWPVMQPRIIDDAGG
jgi:type II secretory pathway component GspD/PulD (secretin)